MANTSGEAAQLDELLTRIENLEMRNAFQDDVIEKLNQELTTHQEQLADFKYQIGTIAERIKSFQQSVVGKQEDEAPPPHY